jgi:hypothetical protein
LIPGRKLTPEEARFLQTRKRKPSRRTIEKRGQLNTGVLIVVSFLAVPLCAWLLDLFIEKASDAIARKRVAELQEAVLSKIERAI